MRIGILGGSFDPIHVGHLLLAEHCREACSLDRVIFIPAAISPHKLDRFPASPESRVEMLRLAVGGHEPFEVSTTEIDRGGVSYTVDTIAEIANANADDSLVFLMGADSLIEFPTWREPNRICEMASIAVVARPELPPPDVSVLAEFIPASRRTEAKDAMIVPMPQMDISSTEIRERVAAGQSIRFQTPRAVEAYINANGLYTK